MELKLTKDRTIVPLINDPEFERLDKSISNYPKPEKQPKSAENFTPKSIQQKDTRKVLAKK